MASSVSESEEFVENTCCVCLKKNRSREADKYCIQCANYFCSSCLDTIHSLIPSIAGHKILGKADFKSIHGSTQGSLPSLPTQRCAQHPSKVLEFYCADHDEVVCPACVFEHRSCREVKSIPENIKNLYSKVMVGDMKKRIPSFKKSLENALIGQEENVMKLKNSYEKAQNEVEAFHKSLREDLEDAKQETLTQLQDDYNRKAAKITEEINESRHLIQSMEKLMSELGKVEGNHAQEFVQLKVYEKLVAKREELQGKQQKQPPSIGVSFTADSDIKAYSQQLKVLGWISTKPVSKTSLAEVKTAEHLEAATQYLSPVSVAKPYASNVTPEKVDANEAGKTLMHKIKRQREINVKIPFDGVCNITGICMTADDNVILADFENKKLKRLDLSRDAVVDYIVVGGQPWAVHPVGMYQVVASFGCDIIKFVSVKETMNITRTLRLNHSCWGVAYHNEKLFMSDGSRSVYIHNMKGQELRKISKGTSSRDIFKDTRHVAINGAGDRVYVADLNNGLIILDIDGNHLSTLCEKDIQISGACGVCTDGRNVFVSGLKSGNVVQIGQDNTFLGQLEIVVSPGSLSFDIVKSSLYVTRSEDNKIVVLDLA